jgi:short subunit dehydrogenase-like uncharacterized protein
MFDIIVFGATGFTGRLVARYLAKQNVNFAIAGRSLSKLQRIKEEDHLPQSIGVLTADSSNAEELRALVQQTKAIITTVGPYRSYGSLLYGICAQAGVCYFDVS